MISGIADATELSPVAADDEIDLSTSRNAVMSATSFGFVSSSAANELHRPAEEFAVFIDVLLPDLVAIGRSCRSMRERQRGRDNIRL